MHTQKIYKSGLAAATTLSLLVACGPPPTTTDPTPTPSVSTGTSPSPTTPTETPSPSASAPASTPTPVASPSATPDTGASPSATPTDTPTVTPTAAPTSDISVVESTTFNGKVYDDEGSPLNGVTVRVRSLSSSKSYDATTTTSGGTYAFNNAPSGIQLEITASKDGYTTRRRVEVLKSNKDGDPDANRYDFGTEDGVEGDSGEFGIGYNGLSDKPEVVSVTPGRNASGIDPATSFVIKFSESMDPETVEDNFAVYTATSEMLSVDEEDGIFSVLTGNTVDGEAATFVGVEGTDSTDDDAEEALGGEGATLVYDESDFDTSWNSDDTEVTFTFADSFHLPTDTESANVPDYLVSFFGVDDGQIKDDSGVTRDEGDGGYFKLTDGNFEMWYDFSIDTDEEEPQVLSVEATDDEAGFDEITVEFSEPMMLNTRAGQILGLDEESPLNPDNYEVQVEEGASLNFGTFLNGTARFDSDDDTNSTVLLRSSDSQTAPLAVVADAANGDDISGTIFYTDGTTLDFDKDAAVGQPRTRGYVQQAADKTVLADPDFGPNISVAAVENISVFYTDGAKETALDMTNPTANTYVELDTALETLTGSPTNAWTVTEISDLTAVDGIVEAGDVVRIQLTPDATRMAADGINRTVGWFTLTGGVFGSATATVDNSMNVGGYAVTTTNRLSFMHSINRIFADLSLDANDGLVATGGVDSTGTTTGDMVTFSDAATLEGGDDNLNNIQPGDVITYTLNAGAATADGKEILAIRIDRENANAVGTASSFFTDALNAPAEGLFIYPGVAAGGSGSIFAAGDNVLVTVSRAVVDPAGNSVDSSNDEEEDTAN